MTADLAVHPCRALCHWRGTPAVRADERVFACSGCGSQWVRSMAWTPIDDDGSIHPQMRAERDRASG